MTSARLAAARVLVTVETGRATLASAIDRQRPGLADARDRALLVEIATGALRWQGQIDAVIARESRRNVDTLDPAVRAALRLGVYQILHLDRVPARAVVFEAVETVRALKQTRAAGFVNAVLRSVQRKDRARVLPALPRPAASFEDQVTSAAAAWSHPAWLLRRWIPRLGFEGAMAWCRFNNATPDVTIRAIDSRRRDDLVRELVGAGLSARASPFVRAAIRLGPGSLGRMPAELKSSYVVQDEGAQIVGHACCASSGMRCLDLCAAPGGKTLVLWSDMRETGLLVASDHRRPRVELLARTMRAQSAQVPLVALDGTEALPFGPVFDRVLLDAPCSGLGTLRREPDIKWRHRPEDLPRFAAVQRAMAHRAAAVVRPGGALVYATCSSEPEENEDIVEAFLAEHPDFRLAPVRFADAVTNTTSLVTPAGFLSTNPVEHGLDAFFAAVLVRSEPA